jgi:hypothetical protein
VAADFSGNGGLDIVGANHGGPYQPVEWWRITPATGHEDTDASP